MKLYILKKMMDEQGLTIGEMAQYIGISRATLRRRLLVGNFRAGEIAAVSKLLDMSEREVRLVFFS